MIRARSGLILSIAVLICAAPRLLAQIPAVAPQPTLAGTWAPSEPARSDQLFAVGLTPLPGRGRLTIEQRPDRLAVTITMPDDMLDPLLDVSGRFYATIIYRTTQGRSGGSGAGGAQQLSTPTWFGDRLVIPNARPSARPITTTTTYSLEGDRLKSETRVEVSAGHANTITEWFTRVRDRPGGSVW